MFLSVFFYIKAKAEICMVVGFVHRHTNGAGQPYGADRTLVAMLLGRAVINNNESNRFQQPSCYLMF